jgi:hypothetical protein
MQTAIETAARMIADAATRQGARLSVAEIEERLFLELSNELQHRQVTRRVCADMFAMNPRTYQRKLSTYRVKVQSRSASLWETVLGFIAESRSVTEAKVFLHFRRTDEAVLRSVLRDLERSGWIWRTGRGAAAVLKPRATQELTRASNDAASPASSAA